MLMKLTADPKLVKTEGLTVFFALLRSAIVKAAHKMLVKSTSDWCDVLAVTLTLIGVTFFG